MLTERIPKLIKFIELLSSLFLALNLLLTLLAIPNYLGHVGNGYPWLIVPLMFAFITTPTFFLSTLIGVVFRKYKGFNVRRSDFLIIATFLITIIVFWIAGNLESLIPNLAVKMALICYLILSLFSIYKSYYLIKYFKNIVNEKY